MNIEICFTPALYPFYAENNDVVIVTDIFRATTTMCMALLKGASAIIPVASEEEAVDYKERGYLVGAERNLLRCEFADFGNSPFEYTPGKVEGKEIVFTTTNGTRALDVAKESKEILIGAFSNLDAVVDESLRLQKEGKILVLCSGWKNRVNIEDMLFAGAFAEKVYSQIDNKVLPDAVSIALDIWKIAKKDPIKYLENTEDYQRMIAHNLGEDAKFCLRQNTLPIVPKYSNSKIRVPK